MAPLVLGVFQFMLPNGFSGQSWRHPDNRSVDYLSLRHWIELARMFEDARLDFLFFADSYGYPTVDGRFSDVAAREAVNFPGADPMTCVSALAAATEQLGFVVTASTVFEEPVANARRFSTLDHLTGGRMGWNIVTGSSQAAAAALFGREMIPHDERYARADDHLDLSLKLWESTWEPAAVLVDREQGVYADPAGLHPLDHRGPYHRCCGMHVVEPSPQRTPVLFQAGSSERGRRYAARNAECVFVQGSTPEAVAASVRDIRAQAAAFGRDPRSVRILVGTTVLTAPTRAAALAKRDEMWAMSSAAGAAAIYAGNTGIDLLALDPERPLSQVHASAEQGRSNVDRFRGRDGSAEPTVGAILEEIRRLGLRGGLLVGTPEEIVDEMERYVLVTDVDGFLLEPHLTPATYEDFIGDVLPLLRRRGLARTGYAGSTLRENLFGPGRRWLADDHPGSRFRSGC